MSEQDMHSNIGQAVAINQQAISGNGTVAGNIIDTKGFESIEFITVVGTITDGAYAFKLEQGDDPGLSDAADVPVDEILGVLTGFVAADDNTAKRVGSIGKKRYQRLSLVATGVTTGINMVTAIAIQGHPRSAPVAE